MKIAPRDIGRFVKSPDPAVRAILVYGPDAGLVRERADALAHTVVDDLTDPFRVAELDPVTLRNDPALLADEAAAVAMTGGRRVVRIRAGGETLPPGPFESWLKDGVGEALVVIEAGDLGPRSPLRRLFEGAGNAAALPCYADEGATLDAVIRSALEDGGLTVSADALAFLAAHLGGDRMLTRRELEKIILYKNGRGEVSLDDARACIGDSASLSLDSAVMAAADGQHAALDRALARLYQEGMSPIAALRGAQRHFQRIHLVAGLIAGGTPADQAIGQLRPPLFFKLRSQFRNQLNVWPQPRAARALELLVEAEAECKRTGIPAEAVCARALFAVANAAARRR